jgi:hypothetical protein
MTNVVKGDQSLSSLSCGVEHTHCFVLQNFNLVAILLWIEFFLLKMPFRNWQVKETSQKASCTQDVAQAEGHAY